MPAGVKLRLDHDHLFLPRDTVDVNLDKRIALVERLHVGLRISGLKRAIKGDFFLAPGALDQNFLPVLRREFFKLCQNLASGLLRRGWRC
jgi:hypothetical protein